MPYAFPCPTESEVMIMRLLAQKCKDRTSVTALIALIVQALVPGDASRKWPIYSCPQVFAFVCDQLYQSTHRVSAFVCDWLY